MVVSQHRGMKSQRLFYSSKLLRTANTIQICNKLFFTTFQDLANLQESHEEGSGQ